MLSAILKYKTCLPEFHVEHLQNVERLFCHLFTLAEPLHLECTINKLTWVN